MIQETYREIEITLLEDENKWRFAANGRERTAPTLPKAREAIDRALDEVKFKKEKAWEPILAWMSNRYGDEKFVRVTITSIAEGSRWSGLQVWVKGSDGKRSKEDLNLLFADTGANAEAIIRIKDLDAESKRIDKEIGAIRGAMDRVSLPATQETNTA